MRFACASVRTFHEEGRRTETALSLNNLARLGPGRTRRLWTHLVGISLVGLSYIPSAKERLLSTERRPSFYDLACLPALLLRALRSITVHCEDEDRTTTILRVFDNDTRPSLVTFHSDPLILFLLTVQHSLLTHFTLYLGAYFCQALDRPPQSRVSPAGSAPPNGDLTRPATYVSPYTASPPRTRAQARTRDLFLPLSIAQPFPELTIRTCRAVLMAYRSRRSC